ncbi:MAG: nitrate/nitrite transporter NrtS [Nitrospirae bacterium]|nr:nitrate/nitrite transporter NrtS [Nitrospirota bacterium]
MTPFLRAAFRRPTVLGAIQVSVVVGSMLNVINQGEAWLHGASVSVGHLILNYLVPYGVATFSAARTELRRCPPDEEGHS